MSILIAWIQNPLGKSNPMSMISLTCKHILFLAMSIFRQLTHGSVLLVILDVFDSFLNFRSRTLFLVISIFSKGDVGSRSDKWQAQIPTFGIVSM
jgi:uncharacterized membrane protein